MFLLTSHVLFIFYFRYQCESAELSQWLSSALDRLEFWSTQSVTVPQELETVRDHLHAFLVRTAIKYPAKIALGLIWDLIDTLYIGSIFAGVLQRGRRQVFFACLSSEPGESASPVEESGHGSSQGKLGPGRHAMGWSSHSYPCGPGETTPGMKTRADCTAYFLLRKGMQIMNRLTWLC